MSRQVVNVRVQTIFRYFLIAGVLFVFCSLLAQNPLATPYAVLVLPLPVALYAGAGRFDRAIWLAGICGLGAIGAGRGFQGALQYMLIAMAGVPVGIGVRRRWTWGITLAYATVISSVAVVGGVLANWQAWMEWSQMLLTAYEEGLALQLREHVTWLREHWASVGVGLHFMTVVLASVASFSAALAILRRRQSGEGVQGSFRTARVSEWLIWAVIAVAALWFADSYWPGGGLRALTWNTAIGLAVVYWLNGLSVLFYGLDVLRPGVLGYVGVVLLVVSFGFYPVCLIGLFDTWGNFRDVFKKLAAERKRREQAEQTDDK